MNKSISRNVSLICGLCGNTLFSALDENGCEIDDFKAAIMYKCTDCGRIATKEQLMEENQGMINDAVEDIKRETVKEMKTDLQKALGKLGKVT